MSIIKCADISFGFTETDHSLISINLATHSNQRGPGYWKLNTSLLSDNDYVNRIRMTVKDVNDEYSYDASVNPALKWKANSPFSMLKRKKKQNCKERGRIEKTITVLQDFLDSNKNVNQETKEASRELEEKKAELENIIERRTKGAILRAKCRWYNEGEKNTKYFLNLEKRHYRNRVTSQLKIKEDEFVTTNKEILNQCQKDLYKSCIEERDLVDNLFCSFIEDLNINTLSEDERKL